MRPPLGIVTSWRFTDRLSKVQLEPGVRLPFLGHGFRGDADAWRDYATSSG